MATLTEPPTVIPSSTSPMPTVYEQDMDSFINLDQLTYTSPEPARPKAILVNQPSLPSTDFSAGDIRSAGFAANSHSPIVFQGPSHQYDEHKQQTGLPPGALAHAMNFNQMTSMGFGSPSPAFPMDSGMFAGSQMKREETSFEFNNMSSRNPSEMDLESDGMGAAPYYFSPNPNRSQFVDPSALGGHEVVSAGPSTQVGRMYPGMHQKQAEMAKAAQQQKQHELLRQQQLQQRRVEEQMHQNGVPQNQPPRVMNPAVEERITRLLQQMRQNAMVAINDTPSPSSSLPQMAKTKKDEQDMDDDERLLASEEGKKLSSKERRQLRNKVSARAFRSRRKEYIGQLESEVATRTNEAHELRLQNRVLFEENARLTDFVRMLLSSPHFSQLLDEMSTNGMPAPNVPQSQTQAPPPQQQQQPLQQQPLPQPQAMPQPSMQVSIPTEAAPAQGIPMAQNLQVGMVMVPSQTLGVPAVSMDNSAWNTGIDMSFGNPSVFAVVEVPEVTLDSEILSGKTSTFLGTCLPEVSSAKDEIPIIERPPVMEVQREASFGVENPDVEIDESDPAFALFADFPTPDLSSEPPMGPFCTLQSKKSATFELVVADEPKAMVDRFVFLCNSMEASFQRVSIMTSHLS